MSEGLEITVRDTTQNTQSVHRFRKFPVRVGRNEMNDLHLPVGIVSQFHAVIDVVDGQIALRDLGSTNGSIVAGQRLCGDSAILGQDEGRFAILQVLIDIRKISKSQVAPPKSKRAMNVTGLLKGPPPELLQALGQAANAPISSAEQAKFDQLYKNYRAAWDQLRQSFQDGALDRSAEQRGDFFTQLSAKYPCVTSEPDFHRMSDAAGSRSLMMRDADNEKSIALEGLKELFSEYVKGQVQPETADDIVRFLTRIRAVLDVFFKAFLPLRDGQRQFERDLAINGSAKTHPVETANTPQMLSSILLSLDQGEEDSAAVVESTLADIMIHHVAMLNGVMRGVKNIISELSPDSVRAYSDQLVSRGVLSKGFGGVHKVLWQAFERRHADLTAEENQLFSLLFGRQFSQAYEEAAGGPGTKGVDRATQPPL